MRGIIPPQDTTHPHNSLEGWSRELSTSARKNVPPLTTFFNMGISEDLQRGLFALNGCISGADEKDRATDPLQEAETITNICLHADVKDHRTVYLGCSRHIIQD